MSEKPIRIRAFGNQETFKDTVLIDSKKTYQIDFSAWAEENHTVTTATWTVEQGQASVSGAALTSNVASALLTFATAGRNLIKVKGTTSAEVYVVWLDILVKDPEVDFINDYD